MTGESTGLWLADKPLVLASRSASRHAVLAGAGIPLDILPADIDERAVEADSGTLSPSAVATLLARQKACAVAAQRPGRLVLGADQTLALRDRIFSKPADVAAARGQLRSLRGRTHTLHSGVVLVRDGDILFEHCETAGLTMRDFSDGFLESYLATVGLAVTASVGAYQVEGAGIHLFEHIDGDHFTILGLPLLGLLGYLRRQGCLAY